MSDYIRDLKTSIKKNKLEKTYALLKKLPSRHAVEKQEVLQIIALATDNAAFELLSFLTLQENQDPEIHERILQLVTDRAHINYRFVLILFENADHAMLTLLVPLFKHILIRETDRDLLSQVIRAAGKRNLPDLVDDLTEFIFYDDAGLKTDAVTALENIGNLDALEKLELSSRTEKCDQQILDAIGRLKTAINKKTDLGPSLEDRKKQKLAMEQKTRADIMGLCSPGITKRFESFARLTRKKVNVSNMLTQDDIFNNHDMMINLLWFISRTTPPDTINAVFDVLNHKKICNDIKFTAYNALEAYPSLGSAATVLPGIMEAAMHIRLSAVKVLDKNLTDYVRAEIKNKIESGTKKGEALAQTVLDAHARNLIEYLMISDTFSYIASNYLAKSAPIAVLNTFIDILRKRNLKSTARKYMDIKEKRQTGQTEPIIVISSSETILHVYSKLIFSCGLSCRTYLNTQEAFETVVFEKPAAVLCDLFLKDMTGFDLAREIRDLYSKKEVPLIISTFQKSLDKDMLENELKTSQANHLVEFPARTNQIKSWVK